MLKNKLEDLHYLTSRLTIRLHIGGRDGMGNPDVEPRNHSQLTFDKGAKAIRWRKNIFQEVVRVPLDVHTRKNESQHIFHKN